MTIEKTPEELFFKEASRALHSNDSEAIDALMEPVDTVDGEIPNKEDVVEDPEVLVDDTDEPKEEVRSEDIVDETPEQKRIAELMKELEEAKKVGHALRSDAGRVPQLQKKLSAVEARLNEMAAKAAKFKEDGSVDEEASVQDAFDNEHFALIEETDPTLAKALKATLAKVLIKTQTQGVDAAREVTNAFKETEEEAAINREWNALISVVPEAPEVFNSFAWAAYKDTLTPEKLALAQSAKASEVLLAIQDFKTFSNTAVPSAKALQTTEERRRKLTTTTPSGSSVGSPAKGPKDEAALFEEAYLATLGLYKRN